VGYRASRLINKGERSVQPDPDNVGDYLISARSFDEYRAMFALTGSDLSGPVLDCPGGGSSFTAQANQAGASAIAADPVYAQPRDSLAMLVMAEIQRGSAHTAAGADRYVWDFYGDLDGHARVRRMSAEAFSRDLIAHPFRYVPASLPGLPFPDNRSTRGFPQSRRDYVPACQQVRAC